MDAGKPMRTDLLPWNRDVFYHYCHLINEGLSKTSALRLTREALYEIWNRADCPCIAASNIDARLMQLLKTLKNVTASNDHRPKEPRTVRQPTRKSSRLQNEEGHGPATSAGDFDTGLEETQEMIDTSR